MCHEMAFGQEKLASGVHLEGPNAAYTMVPFIPPYHCFNPGVDRLRSWLEPRGRVGRGGTFLSSTFHTDDVTQDAA